MVFPIHDQEGQLVAYAGRGLDGGEPRYLFPPGFHKSQVVFNLHRAAGESARCALVVGGFFDACAFIKLATATWWLGWESVFQKCRSSYC
jgi:DNA primase